ncbi:hypothetical protein I7X12_10985 [Halosimplex litoreum]|uniref:Uncharacterized protein n=1 Tax=Halosimplex litoreum TaxID=1198301 RepID=A0A7T3FV90_9EURY|nr:hypothetical protein [Halosimplex litoreum]QPV61295.1 hypothetical protein I7X12_10985 [Halosimplex litoreum]
MNRLYYGPLALVVGGAFGIAVGYRVDDGTILVAGGLVGLALAYLKTNVAEKTD